MKNKVVVVGSYNVDLTFRTDRLPKSGETVIGTAVTSGHGGKGANQAVAAARAGAEVSFIARVGADSYGENALADLRREGINTKFIKIDLNAPTGMASITVDQHGENCIVAVSGANSLLQPEDIFESRPVIAAADVVLVQLESPLETVRAAVDLAHELDRVVILNPAPAQSLKNSLLQQVSIITPNKVEAEMLTGVGISDETSLVLAAERLLSHGIAVTLITLGDRGVYVAQPSRSVLVPAFPVETLDTTGAGDVFNGVLAACYRGNHSLDRSVHTATAAAALAVTRLGTQTAIPYSQEITAFLAQHGSGE